MSQANFQAYREPNFCCMDRLCWANTLFNTCLCDMVATTSIFSAITSGIAFLCSDYFKFYGSYSLGLAMAAKESVGRLQFAISVIPALIAWFASLTSPTWNYSILLITFVCLCIFDNYMVKILRAPRWYPVLRIPLTSVAAVSLIIAQLSL